MAVVGGEVALGELELMVEGVEVVVVARANVGGVMVDMWWRKRGFQGADWTRFMAVDWRVIGLNMYRVFEQTKVSMFLLMMP